MLGESPENKSTGVLYVVATPIGNLEDLTFRALRILKEVSFIACEDTRHTRKLLTKYGIKKTLISYYHPREDQKIPQIMKQIKQGRDVALVTDSGTPGISDPGYPLIRDALANKVRIIPVPGASALTAALSASGLPTHRFLFLGFPPHKKEAARKLLSSVKDEKSTLIFYLPTRKLLFFLGTVLETMGSREIVIGREMTKIHEEFIRGTPEELIHELQKKELKGEATVLIRGSD